MKNRIFKRVLMSIIILLSMISMPFWVSVVLVLFGMIYFDSFFEGVFLFLLMDLLYGTREARFMDFRFLGFIVSLLILFIIEKCKKYFRPFLYY